MPAMADEREPPRNDEVPEAECQEGAREADDRAFQRIAIRNRQALHDDLDGHLLEDADR